MRRPIVIVKVSPLGTSMVTLPCKGNGYPPIPWIGKSSALTLMADATSAGDANS
jgi:hypothetical protein